MAKRFVCVLLVLAMLSAAILMTACSSDYTPEAVTNFPITLNLLGVTNESTTREAIDRVEEAINKITKAMYNIKLNLILVTEEEYLDKLDELLDEKDKRDAYNNSITDYNKLAVQEAAEYNEAMKKAGKSFGRWQSNDVKVAQTLAQITLPQYEVTTIDEDGTTSIVYPDALWPVDIVFVLGEDMYTDFVEDGLLYKLNDFLNGTYSTLKSYIYPTYFEQLKNVYDDSGVYAIPNNNLMAQYTYLVVRKDLAEKYDFDTDAVTNYAQLAGFLASVKANETVTPFRDEPEALGVFKMLGDDIAVGTYVDPILGYSTEDGPGFSIDNLYSIKQYTDHVALMNEYRAKGYFDGGDDFAVAAVVGDSSVEETYADGYYIKILQNPFIESTALYNGMFGVTSFTSYPERCMDVINLINTDTEVKNLFQYGVEGVNYEVVDGLVHALDDSYSMNNAYTGNVYMSLPDGDLGQTVNTWKNYQSTNLVTQLSPFFIFNYTSKEFDTLMDTVIENSVLTYIITEKMGVSEEEFYSARGGKVGDGVTAPQEAYMRKYVKPLKDSYKSELIAYLKELYGPSFPDRTEAQWESLLQHQLLDSKNNIDDTQKIYTTLKCILEIEKARLYTDIVGDSDLDRLTDEALAAMVDMAYEDYVKTVTSNTVSAYYSAILRLKVMWNDLLISSGYSQKEIDSMSNEKLEKVLYELVKDQELDNIKAEYGLADKAAAEKKAEDLIRDFIAVTYAQVSWNVFEEDRDNAAKFTSNISELKEKYASDINELFATTTGKFAENTFGALVTSILVNKYSSTYATLYNVPAVIAALFAGNADSQNDLTMAVVLEAVSYAKFLLSDNELDLHDEKAVEEYVWGEICSRIGITYEEYTAAKKGGATTLSEFSGYTSSLDKKFKRDLMKYGYTAEQIKEFTTSARETALYTVMFEELIGNIGQMCEGTSFDRETYYENRDYAGTFGVVSGEVCGFASNESKGDVYYLWYRAQFIIQAYTGKTLDQIKTMSAEEIENMMIEIYTEWGYFANRMARKAGYTIRDFAKAKYEAASYEALVKRVIEAYSHNLSGSGYTKDGLLDMQRSDALEVISSLERNKLKESCTMNKDALRQMCAEWLAGEKTATDSAEYCAAALADINGNPIFINLLSVLSSKLAEKFPAKEN